MYPTILSTKALTRIPNQYFNVPDEYLGDLPEDTTYGKGSFRETRLLVDGQLAGVAFPYPVIYTGGVVPTAWRCVAFCPLDSSLTSWILDQFRHMGYVWSRSSSPRRS